MFAKYLSGIVGLLTVCLMSLSAAEGSLVVFDGAKNCAGSSWSDPPQITKFALTEAGTDGARLLRFEGEWKDYWAGGGWNWTSIAPLSNLTVRNVIICADEFAGGPGETSVLGHVEVNGGGIQNVYTYGIGSVRINYNDSELVRNAGDVFGAYASRADMVAADV